MGFILFLLATAALLIRPGEQFPELQNLRIYEALVLLCFAFSFNQMLDQFTISKFETRPITVCMFGLLPAVVLSHLSQGNASAAADTGFEFFKIIVYYLLLVANVTSTLRLRVFVICLGLCAVAFVTLSVLQFHEVIVLPEPEPVAVALSKAKGGEITKDAFVKETVYDIETAQHVEVKRLRGTGIFRDPNDMCLLLTLGIFIALYCLTDLQLGILRALWILPLALFFYAMSLTQSRGGLLGLLAGFLALFYARFGWRGLLLLGAPFLPFALVLFGGRMANMSTLEGTGQARIQIWSDGLAAMMSAPIFGIGMSELGALVGKTAHNSFIGAYAELGLFGGTLFFGAFFFALVALQRLLWTPTVPSPGVRGSIARRDSTMQVADPQLRRLLPFLAAILVSYAVGILSLSRLDTVPTYLLLGLITVAVNLAAVHAPAFALRIDGRLVRRWAFASVVFLAASYTFVRVFRA